MGVVDRPSRRATFQSSRLDGLWAVITLQTVQWQTGKLNLSRPWNRHRLQHKKMQLVLWNIYCWTTKKVTKTSLTSVSSRKLEQHAAKVRIHEETNNCKKPTYDAVKNLTVREWNNYTLYTVVNTVSNGQYNITLTHQLVQTSHSARPKLSKLMTFSSFWTYYKRTKISLIFAYIANILSFSIL